MPSWAINGTNFSITNNKKLSNMANLNNKNTELIKMIEDIINSDVYLRNVPYSEDVEKDPNSITDAAEAIVIMLKERGYIINK